MEITTTIYEYITKTVKNEDLRQDIFVALLEKEDVPEFETPQLFRNWLSVFVSHRTQSARSIDANRDRLEEANEDFIRDIYGYNNQADDPMEVLQAEELETELLGSLTELEKDIYGMVIAANLCTYKEAAEVLKITPAALRQHVTRIRRKFNGKATRSEAPHEEVHS